MDHKLEFNEEIKSNDKAGSVNAPAPEMKEYEVVSEPGLFKNGKQYNKGDKIMLSEKTAANFIAAGEIVYS